MAPQKRHNAKIFIFFLSVCCLSVSIAVGKETSSNNTNSTTTIQFCSDQSCPSTTKGHMSIVTIPEAKVKSGEEKVKALASRKYLMGRPGSLGPPRCMSKCEGCTPCKPVQVAVQPGMSVKPDESEYYPEVWRCKCSGKLYMP